MTIFALARQRRLALIALYLRGLPYGCQPAAERRVAAMSREQLTAAIAAQRPHCQGMKE